jgi:hypothetical protein
MSTQSSAQRTVESPVSSPTASQMPTGSLHTDSGSLRGVHSSAEPTKYETGKGCLVLGGGCIVLAIATLVLILMFGQTPVS